MELYSWYPKYILRQYFCVCPSVKFSFSFWTPVLHLLLISLPLSSYLCFFTYTKSQTNPHWSISGTSTSIKFPNSHHIVSKTTTSHAVDIICFTEDPAWWTLLQLWRHICFFVFLFFFWAACALEIDFLLGSRLK